VESNEDILLYDIGHIPGAVKIDWHTDLNDPVERDYIDKTQFAALMARLGIGNDTTVIFYGDKNNWWATYAYWVFQLFGHTNAKIMDGGRMKWIAEKRPLTREIPTYPATSYTAQAQRRRSAPSATMCWRTSRLACRWWMCAAPANTRANCCTWPTIRRRAPARRPHPRRQERALGARRQPDGTFKPAEELRAIYEQEQGFKPTTT
jgi:thiosulfate/3-mercaptopyruvate sulfurtransferase